MVHVFIGTESTCGSCSGFVLEILVSRQGSRGFPIESSFPPTPMSLFNPTLGGRGGNTTISGLKNQRQCEVSGSASPEQKSKKGWLAPIVTENPLPVSRATPS